MPKPRPVHLTFTKDADGKPIVIIPLASGGNAKMSGEDWPAWSTRSLPTRWTLNASSKGYAYVRAARSQASGCPIGVARTLMDAGKGEVVKYRDGDRTNLRRDNLYLASGPAKRRDASIPATPRRPLSKAALARHDRARAALMAAIAGHAASRAEHGATLAE